VNVTVGWLGMRLLRSVLLLTPTTEVDYDPNARR